MLLFVKPFGNENSLIRVNKLVIPLNRIFDISGFGSSIIINYDSGEYIEVDSGIYQKKVESVRIVFNSEDAVDKILRQFYKACNNGSGAFYFGEGD